MTPREQARELMRIARDAASQSGLTFADIYRRTRTPRECYPRQEAMLRQREAGYSLPRIGRFWGKHHTTVMQACRSAAARREPETVIFRSRRVAA